MALTPATCQSVAVPQLDGGLPSPAISKPTQILVLLLNPFDYH